jgi:hypothetical protein
MIQYELVARPWPVFVRDYHRNPMGFLRAIGHGVVVGRRVLRGMTLSYDVRMEDGRIRSFTLDHFWSPENVAGRVIGPAPLRIPAPPVQGAQTCR